MEGTTEGQKNDGSFRQIVKLCMYGGIERTFGMAGEFVREAASLLAIFIPIEYWDKPGHDRTSVLLIAAGSGFTLFGIGAILEYISKIVGHLGKLENRANALENHDHHHDRNTGPVPSNAGVGVMESLSSPASTVAGGAGNVSGAKGRASSGRTAPKVSSKPKQR